VFIAEPVLDGREMKNAASQYLEDEKKHESALVTVLTDPPVQGRDTDKPPPAPGDNEEGGCRRRAPVSIGRAYIG
jgi:hypothetical protein